MATATDLMGLGVGHLMALRVGWNVYSVTAQGASLASANPVGSYNSLVFVNSTNSGSGVKLPQVGGDNPGVLLGDEIAIINTLGATIAVYATTNALGSSVSIIGMGAATAGTTGVSIPSNCVGYFQPITISTWLLVRGSA